jgi:hypothetical protein
MITNSNELIKSLPDFDDLVKVAQDISALQYKKLMLEAKIKEAEANVFKLAFTDEKFFQGGKPASVTFIENTYKYTGLDNSIVPLRTELAEVTAKLEEHRILFDIYKNMLDVWRTLSASERSVT